MFWHNLKYELLNGIRTKDVIFWLIFFPIVLGTLFKVAFSNIYERTTLFSTVPVAVVETKENEIFRQVMDKISGDDSGLFEVYYVSDEEALDMLKNEEISGVIYSGESLSLKVSETGIEQTIIKSFIEQYSVSESIIKYTAVNHPENLENVISKLEDDVNSNVDIPLTEGNTDNTVQYYYNL
jgi:ABC-2 type transport system permease protein